MATKRQRLRERKRFNRFRRNPQGMVAALRAVADAGARLGRALAASGYELAKVRDIISNMGESRIWR